MNKNHVKNVLMIILFLVFIGYYWIFFPVTGGEGNTEREKRQLAEFPQFKAAEYKTYSARLTDYLRDHIPFRYEVTSRYNDLMINTFHQPTDRGVILGKENWLFYNSNAKDPDTNELLDYDGVSRYTEEQMERVAAEVRAADEFCREHGAQMIFLIAPNKSSVYPQYMPDVYVQESDYSRMDQLYEYLCENTEAIVLYPKRELRELSLEYKIFYANDTHWNGLGAYFATQMMMEKFDLDYPALNQLELVDDPSPEDLKLMLGVDNYAADEGNTIPDYGQIYQVSVISAAENMTSYESTNPNGKKMLLLGDSFSEKLVPALGISVTRLDASRTRYYQFAETGDYDYVVYEMVERNLSILAQ